MTGVTWHVLPIPEAWQHRLARALLVLAGLFLVINTLALTAVQGFRASLWVSIAVWIVCAVTGMLWLERRMPKADTLLFPLAMFMSGWGIVIISRLLPAFGERQTLWLIISLIALLATTSIPNLLSILRQFRYLLLVFGLVLLLTTILFGTNPSGTAGAPALWLGAAGIYFQPSELLKIVLVAFVASYLAEQYPIFRSTDLLNGDKKYYLSPRIVGPILLMWGLCLVVLIWQRDLGTAILFFIVFILLLYIASGLNRVAYGGAFLILAAGISAYFLFDVVKLRVDIWWNPWLDPDGRAYQIVQSLMTFSAGGVFGEGIGQGFPAYVPVIHSDFIFSALAEEWGLLGVVTIIVLIAALVSRAFIIAVRQRGRPYHTLLAVGFGILFAVQSILIMGGVVKLIPLTGVTLPFFSYGGSSLLVSFIILGLLLRLSSGES
ncbi:MAG: cell cycle protein [Chloroflexi bacterium OLB15]|nr:MAG: cell cycle protein [Chloroflexi bacterium OLB15]